ncbi:MAG TPA: putative peptidoglycan glycosyltransferase FtsW [Rhabdochlamydiaceae bacterium]|jgi:cell division protein FtsW
MQQRVASCLIVCVVLIFVMGLVMIFNTTSAEILDRFSDRSTHYSLIKQLLYAIVGLICSVGIWFIGYENLLRLSGVLLAIFTLLLVVVFLPGIGQQINGAHRWINVFGNSFQPSEFVKFLIPFYYIYTFSSKAAVIDLKAFLLLLGKLSVPMSLILIEPDNGTVAIIFSTLIVLFVLSRLKWTYWALPLSILCSIGALVALQMPHVTQRIKVYMNPEYDILGKGHQPYQAKIAAGSGKLFGKGFGESLQKMEYLPEARSDYIAAIFAEECGFVGIALLIFLYMLIAYCGFNIAQHAISQEGFYTAAIVTFLLCFQAFLNLGVVSGLLPSKGTNLPFFSQGGSSLLANMMALSVLLHVARAQRALYRNGLKNRELGKETSQNSCLKQTTIVHAEGAREDKNFEKELKLPKNRFFRPFRYKKGKAL